MTEDDKQSRINSNQIQINNYNYLETKNIKNIKKDTLTLHSERYNNQFDNITYIESETDEFKPYVSKLVFKKRGLVHNNSTIKKNDNSKNNNSVIYINNNNYVTSNENNNIKNDLEYNKINKIEDVKKFCSYFGDSNNVYFEIKQFNEKEKKTDNIIKNQNKVILKSLKKEEFI